jgi:hypothetical protein
MVLGMPEISGSHGPELARDLNIGGSRLLETSSLHQPHGGIDDGFRSQPMDGARFQSEYVS